MHLQHACRCHDGASASSDSVSRGVGFLRFFFEMQQAVREMLWQGCERYVRHTPSNI